MTPGSNPRSTKIVATLLMGSLVAITGCAAKRGAKATSFHDELMDFSLVRTVAVLPFENLSSSQTASGRVRDTFMTSLQSVGAVYVLPPGEVARGLDRMGLRQATQPSSEQIIALCRTIEADAVFSGTVLEYGEARSGSASANFISLSLRMFEGETGKVVWSATTTRGGVRAKQRLFGGGGRAMNEVTLDAVNDLIARLFE